MAISSTLRSATAVSFAALLVSACTITTDNGEPATPDNQTPAAQPGAQTAPAAPQTTPPTGGPRSSTGAHNRRILRPIGTPAPGNQPTQPAPAPAGRAQATPLPASGGGETDDTNAQSCVDALEAAAANKCAEARTHAQKCGTDQQDEIVAAVEKTCAGR